MSPALGKPCFVIGQFRITPLSMYTMYSLVVGLPIISCIQCALQALAYSSTVYFFLIESTVLIFTCTVSFLTSDKYKTFLEVINTWLVPSAFWTTNPVFIELLYVTLSFLWTLNKDRMIAMPRIVPNCSVDLQVPISTKNLPPRISLQGQCLLRISDIVQSFLLENTSMVNWISSRIQLPGLSCKEHIMSSCKKSNASWLLSMSSS